MGYRSSPLPTLPHVGGREWVGRAMRPRGRGKMVYLVSLVEPNEPDEREEPDKPNKPEEPDKPS